MRQVRERLRALWRRRGVRGATLRMSGVLLFFLVGYVLASTIGYRLVAPSGWHNITVHGRIFGMDYTVSRDDPGLILACGYDTEYSLNPFPDKTSSYCWQSRDGGDSWNTFAAPFLQHLIKFATPQIVAPHKGGDTFFAVVDETPPAQQDSRTAIWVSHDAGDTWRMVTSIKSSSYLNGMAGILASATYRDGVLYAMLPQTDKAVPAAFMQSTDDGATWKSTEIAPSALERAGWGAYAFTADYSAPHSWYRVLAKTGSAPMLEHSSDDGQTWSTVGPIGTLGNDAGAGYVLVTLATTPERPGVLCAGAGVWLSASADGGRTWYGGPSSVDLSNASGYAPASVQIGSDGSCYSAFTYQKHAGAIASGDWYDALLRLAPSASQSTAVPLSSNFSLDPTGSLGVPNWWYVPADHGMSAHLVIHADSYQLSPAQYMMVMGAESNDNFLFWTAVP